MSMAASNTTLTSLWVEEASNTVIKNEPGITPSKIKKEPDFQADVLQYYKGTGLEPVAQEAGLLDAQGEISGYQAIDRRSNQPIQIIQVVSPAKASVLSQKGHVITTANMTQSPQVFHNTPKRYTAIPATAQSQQIIHTPKGSQFIATPLNFGSPQTHNWGKRTGDYNELDFPEAKRKKEKGGKGLRHFSMKVCEKVQRKGTTSYNEVADELVQEFSDPRNSMSPADQYDQKNIRRRVYDALNVLMAMNIISKEKKEIKWIGLPTNSAQECTNLELEKQRRVERIKHKTQQLQELILQQIAFKNLVQRNSENEKKNGLPSANSAIQLPFIIVNTSKKTVIDCSISNDKYEYLFNFDNTFEIHDDIEVLKRMGMAFGLEKNACSGDNLKRAVRMVPKSLEPYVVELAQGNQSGSTGISRSILSGGGTSSSAGPSTASIPALSRVSSSSGNSIHHQLLDPEIEAATRGLSRQSSYSQNTAEDETYSHESASDRSSPIDV